MKLERIDSQGEGPDVQFFCPGCDTYHGVWTNNQDSRKNWSFNGNFEKPTFSPSLLVRTPIGNKMNICHSFVKDGKIQFLGDCTHDLKNQTVEIPEIE